MSSSERELRQFVLSAECALTPTERLCALALASLADWATGRGQASQAALAAACGVSDRAVRKTIASLKAKSGAPNTPRLDIWTRNDSATGDRLANGYLIRKPSSGALEPQWGGTGPELPGSLSNPLSGATVGYTERSLRPVENEVVPTSVPSRARGLTASRLGKWERAGVDRFEPSAKQLEWAREADLNPADQLQRFRAWHVLAGAQRTQDQWQTLFAGWLRQASKRGVEHANAVLQLVEAVGWPQAEITAEAVQSKAKRDRKVRRAAAKVLRCSQGDLTFSDTQLAALEAALENGK